MKTIMTEGDAAINPEHLIGTKWTTWKNIFGNRMTVEFIDNSNCIYTSCPKSYFLTYTVQEGVIYINNIVGSFVLRGDVLFNNDIPVFEKAV